MRHSQDLTRLGIHGNDNTTGNTVISIVVVVPVIYIPFQDRRGRLLETGIDRQDDIIPRGWIDWRCQVAQDLAGHIHFDGTLAWFPDERVIQRQFHAGIANLIAVGQEILGDVGLFFRCRDRA